jgi:hypothetical protein
LVSVVLFINLDDQRERRAYQFEILKKPSIKTITQTVLKNLLDLFQENIELSPPNHKRPGIVHRANRAITRAPVISLQELIAYSCIARVNQQGRKNVSMPVIKAQTFGDSLLFSPIPPLINFGKVMEILHILGEILVRLIHKSIINAPTANVKLHIKIFEILIKDQNNPSNHHKTQKPITLQRLK